MNSFCTYCDQGYAARLLCLYRSLKLQGEPFRLSVLCFDRATEAVVVAEQDPSFIAIPLAELLAADPAYAAVRSKRSRVESYFTATPALVRHCFGREPQVQTMTYLDADLFFFWPVSAVFSEQGRASVGIVPHRFPPRLADMNRFGTYNVAWVSFRRDHSGLACVEWWRERCLEWCHDRPEPGRFADQGYLNEFPRRFSKVKALDHPGINAGPWNMEGVALTSGEAGPRINGRPLLFFHYQGVRELMPDWFDPGLAPYRTPFTPELRHLIYWPYLRRLATEQRRLQREFGIDVPLGYQRLPAGDLWQQLQSRVLARWVLPGYRRLCGRLLHCPPDEGG